MCKQISIERRKGKEDWFLSLHSRVEGKGYQRTKKKFGVATYTLGWKASDTKHSGTVILYLCFVPGWLRRVICVYDDWHDDV